jgi:hypothetical protein
MTKKQIAKLIEKIWNKAKRGNIIYLGECPGVGDRFSVELGDFSVNLEFGLLMCGDGEHPGGAACKIEVFYDGEYFETGIAYYNDIQSVSELQAHLWQNAMQTIFRRDAEMEKDGKRELVKKFNAFLERK